MIISYHLFYRLYINIIFYTVMVIPPLYSILYTTPGLTTHCLYQPLQHNCIHFRKLNQNGINMGNVSFVWQGKWSTSKYYAIFYSESPGFPWFLRENFTAFSGDSQRSLVQGHSPCLASAQNHQREPLRFKLILHVCCSWWLRQCWFGKMTKT